MILRIRYLKELSEISEDLDEYDGMGFLVTGGGVLVTKNKRGWAGGVFRDEK